MTEDEQRAEDGNSPGIEPMWAIDLVAQGRKLRSSRIDAGYDDAKMLSADILRRTRFKMSADSIWAIERGERNMSLAEFIVLSIVLQWRDGVLVMSPAICGELVDMLRRVYGQ